jgi:hypothetical protein
MTHEDIDPAIREWLYAREALRKLGFLADDLFFACQREGRVIENGVAINLNKPVIMLVLKTQGKQWSWTIGTVDIPVDKIERSYTEACELWNQGRIWRDDDWLASMAFQNRVGLVAELKSKGFSFGDKIIN